MKRIETILHGLPLFRHCTEAEISLLAKKGRLTSIPAGRKFGLKKISSLNVVINGIFEIDTLGKNDIVYLAPGSLFGDIPFTVNRHSGYVRALVDSELLLFDIEEMYRFFLVSFKAMRGYLRAIGKMGFEIHDVGRKYADNRSRIITVYSPYGDSGKTLFASFLGCACSRCGKTIILDLSYKGNSVFNIFEKKITPALSQKQNDGMHTEQFIRERIEPVDDRLSLLNIAFGSKVKVNPDILSPVIVTLSSEYQYIVIDLSHLDDSLRDSVIRLSDIVLPLIKKVRDREMLYDLCDGNLREGQRVLYVLNRQYGRDVKRFEGGFFFERVPLEDGKSARDVLNELCDGGKADDIMKFAAGPRKALVCEPRMVDAVMFAGLLGAIRREHIDISLMYSSAMTYMVIALFTVLNDYDEFRKTIVKLFSEEKINSLLDVTFPDEHVIANSKIYRYTREIAGSRRIEAYAGLPVAMCADERANESRLFSTGYLRDLMAASLLLYPVFEPANFSGGLHHCGFPLTNAHPDDLLRADVDEILYASITSPERARFSDRRILNFYDRYLRYVCIQSDGRGDPIGCDGHVTLEYNEREYRATRMMELSEAIAEKIIREKKIRTQ